MPRGRPPPSRHLWGPRPRPGRRPRRDGTGSGRDVIERRCVLPGLRGELAASPRATSHQRRTAGSSPARGRRGAPELGLERRGRRGGGGGSRGRSRPRARRRPRRRGCRRGRRPAARRRTSAGTAAARAAATACGRWLVRASASSCAVGVESRRPGSPAPTRRRGPGRGGRPGSAAVGVRTQARPSKRSASACAAPFRSEPAIGWPPTKPARPRASRSTASTIAAWCCRRR